MNRVVDLADQSAYLSTQNHLLTINTDSNETTIPFTDLAAVIVSHPTVTFSKAVLSALAENNIAFIVCDSTHKPSGMLLSLAHHSSHAKKFAQQAALGDATKNRLWKEIVVAKIQAQASVLCRVNGGDAGLRGLVSQVRAGDRSNIEAQAARIYWRALFGVDFRRHAADGTNACLNWGYAVLRGVVARSICAAGLHPCLGLHHHHAGNTFCLADDLIEPFRPMVDSTIFSLRSSGELVAVTKNTKQQMLAALLQPIEVDGEQHSLFDVAARLSFSLAAVAAGVVQKLCLP